MARDVGLDGIYTALNARIRRIGCSTRCQISPSAGRSLEIPKALKPSTKVSFVSLGCPKNLVDTEVMMGMLAEAGAELHSSAARC